MKKKIPFMVVADLGYFKFADGVYNHRTGCYFWLDRITREKKDELLSKYNNIAFLQSRCQYAPEIKNPVIFVANSSFEASFEKIRKNRNTRYVAKIFNGCKMFSVTSLDCEETKTRYFCTKKEAEKFIRKNFIGDERRIRLNDLRCA